MILPSGSYQTLYVCLQDLTWCLPSKNRENTRVWLDLPDPGKAFLRPLCSCSSLPTAARPDSVELRHSSPQPCSDSHPQTAGAALGFVFLLFVFGQKQLGIFIPPERTAVFGLRKDEVKKWQEKAVSLCFWLLDCFFAPAPDFHW